ncbi:FAD:protein FMN transferase [Shewanella youngdeokensis]|uniref:FAD:protein FMN transferase n=1 Tax=Shewanella youngdeokensis TaxID=2999068 RepID=A0ABZ0JZW2_9GAMM|nr:FAD:protein FMN transferase [Shewanella sp. DAU334]
MLRLFFAFLTLFYSSILFANEASVQQFSGRTMGQEFHINWYVPNNVSVDNVKLKQSVRGTLNGLNGIFSTWKDNSELSRFNQLKHTQPVSISPQLSSVISKAIELNEQTNGALDITVEPLIKLWGFGPHHSGAIPSQEELQQVLQYTGVKHIQLEDDMLRKLEPRVQLDLSAIAKGYAVDRIGEVLERYGIHRYMVEIGGEIVTKGQPWQIAVQQPAIFSTKSVLTLSLSGKAVATSGDYRQFYSDQHKQRYSHIVDPRTGSAKVRDIASVTVIADDCATADGFATALMVLGAKEALALAEAKKLPVLLITPAGDDQFTLHQSSYLKPFINN